MIDLSTTYMGLKLRTPLVPSASPLTEDLDNIRLMEDCGAAAVVLPSLFEEQIEAESLALTHHLEEGTHSFTEAQTFFPSPKEFMLTPDAYLDHIRKAREAVDIPIIASLNGITSGGWTEYARYIEDAGAHALELNVYYIPTDLTRTGNQVDQTYVDILSAVKAAVKIPVAMKLSPYFSNLADVARQFSEAGASALVLFNRFYQPDIDLESLEVRPSVIPSSPQALRLPMRWIAILSGRLPLDFAATSGIHQAHDVLKMVMAGACVTQLCSTLLMNGISHIRDIERGLRLWMDDHEYGSLAQMRGSMSQLKCPDPSAFERAQYVRTLKSVNLFKRR